MATESPADAPDWLGACRRSVSAIATMLNDRPTIAERVIETGTRGEGGDRTLEIDKAAEDIVFGELDALHAAGARFCAVSEERGMVDFGSSALRVIIDPIDGSLNAKRGLPHFALSVAVADGPTMADVAFGFVYDLGPSEEWRAVRGGGAFLNDVPLDDPLPERRRRDGKLELVAIESANPRWLAASSDALVNVTGRVRAMGSIAISLCQVAATRVDGMASLWNCRAVDAAAGQLVVREAGGVVAFTACDDPLAAPLDLEPRSPVVAARTQSALAELATLPASDLEGTTYS